MENTSRAIIYKHKSDPPCDTEKKRQTKLVIVKFVVLE